MSSTAVHKLRSLFDNTQFSNDKFHFFSIHSTIIEKYFYPASLVNFSAAAAIAAAAGSELSMISELLIIVSVVSEVGILQQRQRSRQAGRQAKRVPLVCNLRVFYIKPHVSMRVHTRGQDRTEKNVTRAYKKKGDTAVQNLFLTQSCTWEKIKIPYLK